MPATLAYRPAADAPDFWDVLNAEDRHARPEVSDRQRVWSSTKGGPRLAALLAEVAVDTLTASETISFARAVHRQQSWTDSLLLRASERFVHHRPGPEPHQESLAPGSEQRVVLGGEGCPGMGSFAIAEWAVGLRITRTAAHHLMQPMRWTSPTGCREWRWPPASGTPTPPARAWWPPQRVS
jgi:hypothetical protein